MNKLTNISIDKLNAILFDFDGVLAESMNVKTEAFSILFETYGEDIVKKVVKHHIENGGISRYKKIEYYYKEYLNQELLEGELKDLAEKFSDLVVVKVIRAPWVEGAEKFLEKHYRHIDLYVVSGTPQKELELIIEKRNMNKYFKGVFGTPETKPAIANRLINENNYNRKKVLYIGDSLSDYHDSQKADLRFLGRVPKDMETVFPDNVPVISDFFDLTI